MKFRPIVLAWLLLLGATFAMAGGAWWLLDREADRVETLAAATLANGAASVAESVDLLMEEIRTGVSDGLLAARVSSQPRVGLAELVMNNPFVQTGFYYRESDGVTAYYGEHETFPSPLELMKSSEGRFPLTFEEEEQLAQDVAPPDMSLIFNPTTIPSKIAPSSNASAPSDLWQAAVDEKVAQAEAPIEVQVSPNGTNEPAARRQEILSKSVALKQQRANLRQVNEYSNAAVYNAWPEEEGALSKPSSDESTFALSGSVIQEEAQSLISSFGSSVEVTDSHASPEDAVGGFLVGNLVVGKHEEQAEARAEPISFYNEKSAHRLADSEDVDADSNRDFSVSQTVFPQAAEEIAVSGERKLVFPNRYIIRPPHQGWITESIDELDQWMTWVDLRTGKDIMGVWLDREAVIAELGKTVNISQLKDVQFALVDNHSHRIAGAGGERYGSWASSAPSLVLQVGAAIPGWRIEAYPALRENPFGRSFRLLGGLVVVGLSLAILLGGSLLLWQAQRDAREAQLKTTFVANVSHELKTPLTSIRLFAEMLYDGRAGDETKQRRYLQTMLNETQRLTRLVNNVLDFSRLERGRRDFQLESIDVGQAVQEIIDIQMERLHGEGLALEFKAPEITILANIDRDALEQILLNLLDNAAKYAASGERAQVMLESLDDSWCLSVVDFGPGIPAREQCLVFEAFHRIDDRLTADRPGCGLGLSIAARLAQGLGGRLSLQPNHPQGCCFNLIVPNVISQ